MNKRVHITYVWLIKLDDYVFEAVVGSKKFAEERLNYHFIHEIERNMFYWLDYHNKFGLPDEHSVEETARRARHWHVTEVPVEFEHRYKGLTYV